MQDSLPLRVFNSRLNAVAYVALPLSLALDSLDCLSFQAANHDLMSEL